MKPEKINEISSEKKEDIKPEETILRYVEKQIIEYRAHIENPNIAWASFPDSELNKEYNKGIELIKEKLKQEGVQNDPAYILYQELLSTIDLSFLKSPQLNLIISEMQKKTEKNELLPAVELVSMLADLKLLSKEQ